MELNFSNEESIQNYFLLGYIPAPLTMYQNTYKLKSGEVLEFNFKDSRISKFEFTYKKFKRL